MRLRKAMKITHMVVMQVTQDDVTDLFCFDRKQLQGIDRATQECSLSLGRNFCGEPAIDDEGPFVGLGAQEKIVHRDWPLVRVAANKMVAASSVSRGIAKGKQLVFRQLGRHVPPLMAAFSALFNSLF